MFINCQHVANFHSKIHFIHYLSFNNHSITSTNSQNFYIFVLQLTLHNWQLTRHNWQLILNLHFYASPIKHFHLVSLHSCFSIFLSCPPQYFHCTCNLPKSASRFHQQGWGAIAEKIWLQLWFQSSQALHFVAPASALASQGKDGKNSQACKINSIPFVFLCFLGVI